MTSSGSLSINDTPNPDIVKAVELHKNTRLDGERHSGKDRDIGGNDIRTTGKVPGGVGGDVAADRGVG